MTVEMAQSSRILVLEDEGLVAMHIQDLLEDHGYVVLGPVRTVEDALSCLEGEVIDAALLDVNLGKGGTSFPVATVLKERAIPFVFLTGYGEKGLQEPFSNWKVLSKPVDEQSFLETLEQLLQPRT
jgi:CheY-like chemotaxis protein